MSKFFIDTEFLEGTQKKRFLGVEYGYIKPTIDLISIGIVSEDGREYYAISKDFNLKEAWNRYQMKQVSGDARNRYPEGVKEYWIRKNVLRPIFDEWKLNNNAKIVRLGLPLSLNDMKFNYKNFKHCIKCIGKTNKQIAKEIRNFVMAENYDSGGQILLGDFYPNDTPNPQFYAYYADYDWVALCQLFGSMMNLQKGFPLYCIDLKQILDEKQLAWNNLTEKQRLYKCIKFNLFSTEINLKNLSNYPKQTNEHSAIFDARWNKELYEFLSYMK